MRFLVFGNYKIPAVLICENLWRIKKMIDNCEYEIVEKDYNGLLVKLAIVKDFDTLLDHYVEHEPDDTDMIPYYAALWSSAETLAKVLVSNRKLIAGKKVLELGAGLALPSVVCSMIDAKQVVASDFHPDNKHQVDRNAELNSVSIDYMQLDWTHPKNEKFDILVGSDLLYEGKSVNILVKCVKNMQNAVDKFAEVGIKLELWIEDEILILSNYDLNIM
jgi:2-polyprenyl-3-methyl-5-hydroxy-6-metoxy-1,4-benzoquinol methylase